MLWNTVVHGACVQCISKYQSPYWTVILYILFHYLLLQISGYRCVKQPARG